MHAELSLDRAGPMLRHALGQRLARWAAASLAAMCLAAQAGAPTGAPQVLLAITNSESMDGTTSGAIMVGSGSLASAYSSLSASASPTNYTIPSGFTPPLNAGSNGQAPYTVSCGSGLLCDNGPSRLNMTKAAIQQVLTNYGSSLNFGLYAYSTGSPSLYTTWVYYMSPTGGFGFTSTAASNTVANPCYQYSSGSSTVKSNCTQIDGVYAANIGSSPYMTIAASSDDAQINDVLYTSGGFPAVFLTYGTVSPANPYTSYALSTYNNSIGSYSVSYGTTTPNVGGWATTPTNAGFVPSSPQVLYAMRGFGYGASQSATTGSVVVPMGTDPSTSTAFTTALAPETNSTSSSEIKASAGQSALYGILNGAKAYLGTLTKTSCQKQYVVLLTDGLPTLDQNGKAWPPLGTRTANAYGLTANFAADGSFLNSNSQAVTDAINAAKALNAAGIQVFVIGLGAGVDASINPMAAKVLQALALAGGSANYYAASDTASLNAAFQSIAATINSENAVSAPLAPVSVAGGHAFEYELTSIAVPGQGHVRAYAVDASGVPASTASWDAAQLMTVSQRQSSLYAPKTDNTMATLSALDAAAFNLTATSCVPDTATIVGYTVNPSYSGACSYLGSRKQGWLLGLFSTQNGGAWVGPPSSSYLTHRYSSYVTYARNNASRTPMLLFSNQDGFIYSVSPSTGALNWGWTTRNLIAKLQNYATFPTSGATNGGFAVVDAMDSSAVWGSYLVGSLQSGAEHYVVKLDGTGKPATLVYDAVVSGATAAGDKAGSTGTVPLRQPPVVAYIGNTAYYVYVTTVGTTSTLYETAIGSGTTTSAALPFTVSSALSLTADNNRLWLGGTDGSVRVITLTSGDATTDAGRLQTIGNTVVPSSGASAGAVLYVGQTEISGVQVVYALNAARLTVFNVTSSGWTPLWTTTPSGGSSYAGGSWSGAASVASLTASSVVSDAPVVVGSALLVPVYVAGSACSAGSGYYDFFDLKSGGFPSSLPLTLNNAAITANFSVGSGVAYTPSITFTTRGVALAPGAGSPPTPQPPLTNNGTLGAKPISWQRRN